MLQIEFGQNIAFYVTHLCSLDCRGKLFQNCPRQNVIALQRIIGTLFAFTQSGKYALRDFWHPIALVFMRNGNWIGDEAALRSTGSLHRI
jgi:hypothetical protein